MAKKLSKSAKQFLSVLFHLVVLVGMVLAYDAVKSVGVKLGWIEGDAIVENLENTALNYLEHEPKLSTEIDPALQKLVMKKDDGYLFRTDIAFPPHLKVIVSDVTRAEDMNIGRRVGVRTEQIKHTGRMEKVMEYEMAGKTVRFTQVQDVSQRKPSKNELAAKHEAIEAAKAAGKESPEDPDRVVGRLVGEVIQFSFDRGKWKTQSTGSFKTMAWGKELEPKIDAILVSNGLKPTARWFGANALPIGHKLRLAGPSLDLILDNAEKGSIDMEFAAIEGVHGHPCAVFDITGSIELKPKTDAEGRTKTGEETIESGRVWFSLLYPVVMRTDLDKIVSYEIREKGKLVEQGQGREKIHRHSNWKAVTAQPKKAPAKK